MFLIVKYLILVLENFKLKLKMDMVLMKVSKKVCL